VDLAIFIGDFLRPKNAIDDVPDEERQQDAEHSEKKDTEIAGGSKDAGKQDYGDQFLPVDAPDRAFADVSHSVEKEWKRILLEESVYSIRRDASSLSTKAYTVTPA